MPFTPFIEKSKGDVKGLILWDRDRAHVELDESNMGLWDKYAELGEVYQASNPVELTDEQTGIVFLVRSADCGLGCHCAAEITEIVHNPNAEEK